MGRRILRSFSAKCSHSGKQLQRRTVVWAPRREDQDPGRDRGQGLGAEIAEDAVIRLLGLHLLIFHASLKCVGSRIKRSWGAEGQGSEHCVLGGLTRLRQSHRRVNFFLDICLLRFLIIFICMWSCVLVYLWAGGGIWKKSTLHLGLLSR